MQEGLTQQIIDFVRLFSIYERDLVCCGRVTVQQCVALQYLLEKPQDITALAEHAGTSHSATTRLVDGLEKNGWIARVRDGDDRRRVEVKLTDLGVKEANRLKKATEKAIASVMSQIPEAQHGKINECFALIRSAMARCCEKL